jgi:hypothetical protein
VRLEPYLAQWQGRRANRTADKSEMHPIEVTKNISRIGVLFYKNGLIVWGS